MFSTSFTTSVRHLPLAEQYPSKTAAVKSLSSQRNSAMIATQKNAPAATDTHQRRGTRASVAMGGVHLLVQLWENLNQAISLMQRKRFPVRNRRSRNSKQNSQPVFIASRFYCFFLGNFWVFKSEIFIHAKHVKCI